MNREYIFESERLGFRDWYECDEETFAKMNNSRNVMRYFPNLLSRKESDNLIERFKEHNKKEGFSFWVVENKLTKEFIGSVGLLRVNLATDFKDSVEIGWRLDDKHWRKGYAANSCLDYGFNVLNLDEIYAFTAKINIPSENLMKKLKMEKIKNFNHPNLADNSPLSEHVLYVKRKI